MPRNIKKRYNAAHGRSKRVAGAAARSRSRRNALVKTMRRVASRVVQRNIETKTSQLSSTDGIQIPHNNFVYLTTNGNLLHTQNGTADVEVGTGQRIGDRIKLRGVSLKFMLELNERYSDVTFRILVVKSARDDVPTDSTLWNHESGNKMMDTLNKERFSIIAQKFTKLTARNLGLRDITSELSTSGIYTSGAAAADNYLSRATKILKIWVPGSKFAKRGNIVYENGGTRQKFFDYHVLVYAYANYSTTDTPPLIWNVGRVNEFLTKMYYKDA